MTVTNRRESPSWTSIVDDCLRDHQRFRRMLLLSLVFAAFTITLVAIAGWPLASAGSVATYTLTRRRMRGPTPSQARTRSAVCESARHVAANVGLRPPR